MRFKSVKFSIRVSLSALAFALPLVSSAATTVTPVRNDGTALSNVYSGKAYYPTATMTLTSHFLDVNDTSVVPNLIDITKGQVADGVTSSLLYFNLTSDKTLTIPEGGFSVVAVMADGTSGKKLVPIAYYGPYNGGGTLCATDTSCQGLTSGYFLAVRYTIPQTLQLGLYPRDICYYYNTVYAGTAYGCTGAAVLEDASTAMQLSFQVTTVANASTTTTSDASNTTADATLSLLFTNTAPTLSCTNLNSSYFPGDGLIYVNGSYFGLSGTPKSPARYLIVIANEEAAVVATNAYATNNDVVVRTGFSENEMISGFTNTTDGADHRYELTYMVRDYGGVVVYDTGACSLTTVRTSPELAFLNESRCFIATAAFRSGDAGPVLLLREFRDRILLKSALGSQFVRLYYRWSPGAAEWLLENPAFRLPVLMVLAPLQALAWLVLHPLWILILAASFAMSALVLSRLARRSAT